MTDRAEEIFEDSCDVNMYRFDLIEFKDTHKMLYSSILHAMENYSILKSQDDFKEKFPSKAEDYLKQKVSEITDEEIELDGEKAVEGLIPQYQSDCWEFYELGAKAVKEKLLNKVK